MSCEGSKPTRYGTARGTERVAVSEKVLHQRTRSLPLPVPYLSPPSRSGTLPTRRSNLPFHRPELTDCDRSADILSASGRSTLISWWNDHFGEFALRAQADRMSALHQVGRLPTLARKLMA